MIRTEYICDKCGHSQGTESDMWDLGISIRQVLPVAHPGTAQRTDKNLQMWCRACVEEIGYLNNYTKDLEAKARGEEIVRPTPPSFEDLIRELVEEIVEEREDG